MSTPMQTSGTTVLPRHIRFVSTSIIPLVCTPLCMSLKCTPSNVPLCLQLLTMTLGLPLAVTPDFATQSCQWSWGEVPLPPEQGNSTPCQLIHTLSLSLPCHASSNTPCGCTHKPNSFLQTSLYQILRFPRAVYPHVLHEKNCERLSLLEVPVQKVPLVTACAMRNIGELVQYVRKIVNDDEILLYKYSMEWMFTSRSR